MRLWSRLTYRCGSADTTEAGLSRWEDEITAAVITGITNATSESLNRLAKTHSVTGRKPDPG